MGSGWRAAAAVCAVETDGVATWRNNSARTIFAATSRILPKHNKTLARGLLKSGAKAWSRRSRGESGHSPRGGSWNGQASEDASRAREARRTIRCSFDPAESIGHDRIVQRQLEAARHLTDRADGFRGNGHVPRGKAAAPRGLAEDEVRTAGCRQQAGGQRSQVEARGQIRGKRPPAATARGRSSEPRKRAAAGNATAHLS